MSEDTNVRLGIDLGGTKIEIVALDEHRNERLRRRVPTPPGDYDATLGAIARLVGDAERGLGMRARVGIGIPGSFSRRTGLVKNANSTVLIGKPLKDDLEARLERPVRVANDANCFALSEARDGAARGYGIVFGVILGTGVGGGIVVDGRVIDGRNAIAGEWGHNPLPWPRDDERPGPPCYCGKDGCIETFLSGPALAHDYRVHGGEARSAVDIAEAAASGEPRARAALERYEDRLARALATIVNVLDPDAIVLGGGVSNIARLYDRLPTLMQRYVFSDTCDTPIARAAHGDSSGVRGAAMLWD